MVADDTIKKLLDKLYNSPPNSYVESSVVYRVLDFLFTENQRLRAVVEKHESNMAELLETYGIELTDTPEDTPEDTPTEQPDPKSLYSVFEKSEKIGIVKKG